MPADRPDFRPASEPFRDARLLRLGGTIARHWTSLVDGEIPPDLADGSERHAAGFWNLPEVKGMAFRLFLEQGRPRELVRMYDAAVRSPDDFAAQGARGDEFSLTPLVVTALRQVGCEEEARRMLALAERDVRMASRRGRLPLGAHFEFSRILAVQGKADEALASLERAVALGWPWSRPYEDWWLPRPDLASDPAFRSLRDHPRIRELDAMIGRVVARERRELIAAGVTGPGPG